MTHKIGFTAEYPACADTTPVSPAPLAQTARASLVQVHFASRNMTLAYYNDRFDLHRGDLVYVDGKLTGLRGRVVDVSYSFKIRLADYKRVIAVADTNVSGRFYLAGSHLVTFDRTALPIKKAMSWFKAPEADDVEYASGVGDENFCLDDLSGMKLTPAVAERGHNYYVEDRVRYLELDGTHGSAIVEGSEIYELAFEYRNGEISALTCSCYCGGSCKHGFAAMLQLRDTLERVEGHYADEFARSDYLAAIFKPLFFSIALDGRESGSITL